MLTLFTKAVREVVGLGGFSPLGCPSFWCLPTTSGSWRGAWASIETKFADKPSCFTVLFSLQSSVTFPHNRHFLLLRFYTSTLTPFSVRLPPFGLFHSRGSSKLSKILVCIAVLFVVISSLSSVCSSYRSFLTWSSSSFLPRNFSVLITGKWRVAFVNYGTKGSSAASLAGVLNLFWTHHK